jgi:hypothetical protein
LLEIILIPKKASFIRSHLLNSLIYPKTISTSSINLKQILWKFQTINTFHKLKITHPSINHKKINTTHLIQTINNKTNCKPTIIKQNFLHNMRTQIWIRAGLINLKMLLLRVPLLKAIGVWVHWVAQIHVGIFSYNHPDKCQSTEVESAGVKAEENKSQEDQSHSISHHYQEERWHQNKNNRENNLIIKDQDNLMGKSKIIIRILKPILTIILTFDKSKNRKWERIRE